MGREVLGSFRDAVGGFGQAQFRQVDPDAIQSMATASYDPTTLFMTVALARINQKLDVIQDAVNEALEERQGGNAGQCENDRICA